MCKLTWFIGFVLIATSILISIVVGQSAKTDSYINDNPKNSGPAIKRPSFFVGSRYGRSPYYGSSSMHNLKISPRNDRFFLGSRYGKRSDEYMQEISEPESSRDNTITSGGFMFMSCTYTGVKDFYRCYKGHENNSMEPYESSSSETEST